MDSFEHHTRLQQQPVRMRKQRQVALYCSVLSMRGCIFFQRDMWGFSCQRFETVHSVGVFLLTRSNTSAIWARFVRHGQVTQRHDSTFRVTQRLSSQYLTLCIARLVKTPCDGVAISRHQSRFPQPCVVAEPNFCLSLSNHIFTPLVWHLRRLEVSSLVRSNH